ncbi:MAG: HEAT repeat domain-containing protein [Planctomycetes bacterium]|nr:HEAT repeat domain-containing protein [Planctomycetota bacterium]
MAVLTKSVCWRGCGLLGSAALFLGLSGCAGLWDEITSNNRDLKGYFFKPDPLQVIRESNDGAKRGDALSSLREPLQNGGTQKDQDAYINILTAAATVDREPLCRLGAIHALSAFKDPRAAQVLEEAYTRRLSFGPELNGIIRQQTLEAIGKIGNPDSRHLLIRVARQPSGAVDASLIDQQQTQDERLTAIRALSRYKQADAIETLVYIMETERDLAYKDRTVESLRIATGKNLPPDPKAWRDLMAGGGNVAPEPNFIQRVVGNGKQ